MARFRCAPCDRNGAFVHDPTRHVCPNCGSNDVVFALTIDELPDEVFDALARPGHPTTTNATESDVRLWNLSDYGPWPGHQRT